MVHILPTDVTRLNFTIRSDGVEMAIYVCNCISKKCDLHYHIFTPYILNLYPDTNTVQQRRDRVHTRGSISRAVWPNLDIQRHLQEFYILVLQIFPKEIWCRLIRALQVCNVREIQRSYIYEYKRKAAEAENPRIIAEEMARVAAETPGTLWSWSKQALAFKLKYMR